MASFIKDKLEKVTSKLLGNEKRDAEIRFWKKELQRYVQWYDGAIGELYGHPAPSADKKVVEVNKQLSALLTFFEIHQKTKYLKDLLLEKDSFKGMKVLDIGSGPFPSGLCFEGCEVYCLDPLFDSYLSAGFPIHCYGERARFVQARAESIPLKDGYFDAIISVNAIDHVDSFEQTARELKRVLKPGGRFRMHVHYHPRTTTEPIELNDEIFSKNYSWVNGIKRLHESKTKTGSVVESDQELYVVWGN
jgi:SAM-dependent methyltransferase